MTTGAQSSRKTGRAEGSDTVPKAGGEPQPRQGHRRGGGRILTSGNHIVPGGPQMSCLVLPALVIPCLVDIYKIPVQS